MRRQTIVGFAGIAAFVFVGAISLTAFGAGVPKTDLPLGAQFSPLPEAASASAGITLDPLPTSQFAAVSVTPSQALGIAESYENFTPTGSDTVTTSLGSFTDTTLSTSSSNGDLSPAVTSRPAYVVTFGGLTLPELNGSGFYTQMNVAIDAQTGQVIEGFQYQ
jgi:hypothetical protein